MAVKSVEHLPAILLSAGIALFSATSVVYLLYNEEQQRINNKTKERDYRYMLGIENKTNNVPFGFKSEYRDFIVREYPGNTGKRKLPPPGEIDIPKGIPEGLATNGGVYPVELPR